MEGGSCASLACRALASMYLILLALNPVMFRKDLVYVSFVLCYLPTYKHAKRRLDFPPTFTLRIEQQVA